MKIVSCFTRLEELEPLAEAGADEFYTAIGELPAFSFGFLPFNRLRPAIEKAHALGKPVALAVNAIRSPSFKNPAAVPEKVRMIDAMGIDAFIVSSPHLLESLSSGGPRLRARLQLSSVQPVFNSMCAAFFARFGISRIILPNQLTEPEARKIVSFCRKRSIETEIFDYRFFGCAYVNGRCHLHKPVYYRLTADMSDGSMCRINADPRGLVGIRTLEAPARAKELPAVVRRLETRLAGGGAPRLSNAASFFDFFSSGVQYLKYGTRHDSLKFKVGKVKALRAMLDLAEKLSSSLPKTEARRAFIKELTRWDGGGF